MKTMKKRIVALLLTMVMTVLAVACSTPEPTPGGEKTPSSKTTELTTSSSGQNPDLADLKKFYAENETFRNGLAAFSMKLMATCYEGDTMMISPLSVYTALGMLANGAEGETKKQLEDMFGCSVSDINKGVAYLIAYTEQQDVLRIANSIWLNSDVDMEVKKEFLSICGDYYRSAVFRAPFSDKSTIGDINNWVKKNTKNRIEKIMEQLNPELVMVLMNAITFDGEWVEPFKAENTCDEDTFTRADGSVKKVDIMYGNADRYFEDDDMTGCEKHYKKGYLFRAYLPKEGKSVADLLQKLSENRTLTYLNSDEIHLRLPKIKEETTIKLDDALQKLGMQKAYSGAAEFGAMTDAKVKVNTVLHKTFIKVDEKGTEAAAVTAISMDATAYRMEKIVRFVNLDHPFVYEIVDEQTGITIFTGVYQ